MTSAAVITLSVALVILAIGLLITIAWARNEIDARGIAQEERLATERKCLDLEDERDDERARATKAEAARDKLKKECAIFEAAAKAAREELTKHVREKLVAGSDSDVASEVDRLLGVAMSKAPNVSNVPGVPTTPSSDDRGSTGT